MSATSLNSKASGIIELDGSQYSALRMELEVERRVRRQRTTEQQKFGFKPGPVRSAEETNYDQLKREAAALVARQIKLGAVKVSPPDVQAQAVRDEVAQYQQARRRVYLKCGLTTHRKPRVKPSKHTTGGVKLTQSRAAYMRAYRRVKFLKANLTTSGTPRKRVSKYGGKRIVTDMQEYQRQYRQQRNA